MIALLILAVLLAWIAAGLIIALLIGRTVSSAERKRRLETWRGELRAVPVSVAPVPTTGESARMLETSDAA